MAIKRQQYVIRESIRISIYATHVETLHKILIRLGREADLETIIDEALKIGIPPPIASRYLMRLIERGRVKIVCGPSLQYRAV